MGFIDEGLKLAIWRIKTKMPKKNSQILELTRCVANDCIVPHYCNSKFVIGIIVFHHTNEIFSNDSIPNALVDVIAPHNTFNSAFHYGHGRTTHEHEIHQN